MPLEKAEDFGAHANQYYPLDISYFKSSLDTSILNTLWNKYWIATLSASPVRSRADTYAPRPPLGTYGLRVPASRVVYVPDAQGGLPPGPHALYVLGTRTSSAVPYVPRTVASQQLRLAGYLPRCSRTRAT